MRESLRRLRHPLRAPFSSDGAKSTSAVIAHDTGFYQIISPIEFIEIADLKTHVNLVNMKQQSLFADNVRIEFGGNLLKKGRRKEARPLDLKRPVHLVLKAEDSVQLFQSSALIKTKIEILSHRFGVKVYSLAIHEDHIHVVLMFPSRRLYRAWVRSLTGTLSRQVKGLKWRFRPYTKLLTWGKQFNRAKAYLETNNNEAEFLKKAWSRQEEFETQIYQDLRELPMQFTHLSSGYIISQRCSGRDLPVP